MWTGTGGWNQWAFQASTYQNVPHEQIDWAAMAKQWIQMQQGRQEPENMIPSDHSHEVLRPPPLSMQSQVAPAPLMQDGMNEPVPAGDAGYSQGEMMGGYWAGNWEVGMAGEWESSQNDVSAPPTGKETFDYGHIHGNQPLTGQTFDYNHGNEAFEYAQVPAEIPVYPAENQYPVENSYPTENQYVPVPVQYWPQVSEPVNMTDPPFLKKDRGRRNDERSPKVEEELPQIDAAKRKQLPAWIREGLEKMEREKQKHLERERRQKLKAQKEAEVAAAAQEIKDDITGENRQSLSLGIVPNKSRFESDEESDDEPEAVLETKNAPKSPPKRTSRAPSPEPDYQTEEERHQEMILKVRRLLTEILLFVTNEEILSVAREVFQRALSKAPARQLATSSALASIASGLGGITGYGSDSEGGGSDVENTDDSDSDSELERRIREKQKAFALKEKDIFAALEEEEARYREREHHWNKDKDRAKAEEKGTNNDQKPGDHADKVSFLKPSPEPEERYHFGKKYDSIPGLDIDPTPPLTDTKLSPSHNTVSNNGVAQKEPGTQPDLPSSVDSESDSKSSSTEGTRKEKGHKTSRDGSERVAKKGKRKQDTDSGESTDSSSSNSSDHSSSKGRRKKKKHKHDSRSSSRNRHEDRDHSSKYREKYGNREERSRSRDRHHRDRSRSRDRSKSRYHRSSSREGSTYRDSYSHREKGKSKSYKKDRSRSRSPPHSHLVRKHKKGDRRQHSRSRSSSRSPKKSQRRYSRSVSPESEESGKKSSAKHRSR